jgi:hypothetical protein
MKSREILISDLTDRHPCVDANEHLRVDAVMLYPNDVASQDQYIRLLVGECERYERQAAADRPSALTRRVFLQNHKAWRAGQYAGAVFLFFLRMLIYQPKQASIEKAQFLVRRTVGRRPDRSTIKRHWSEFRACSHFHAADMLAHEIYKKDFHSEFGTSRKWMLQVAHYMLRHGLDLDAARLGNGWWTVSNPEVWKHPDDFEIPPLSERQLELLSQYRAPTRPK